MKQHGANTMFGQHSATDPVRADNPAATVTDIWSDYTVTNTTVSITSTGWLFPRYEI